MKRLFNTLIFVTLFASCDSPQEQSRPDPTYRVWFTKGSHEDCQLVDGQIIYLPNGCIKYKSYTQGDTVLRCGSFEVRKY